MNPPLVAHNPSTAYSPYIGHSLSSAAILMKPLLTECIKDSFAFKKKQYMLGLMNKGEPCRSKLRSSDDTNQRSEVNVMRVISVIEFSCCFSME